MRASRRCAVARAYGIESLGSAIAKIVKDYGEQVEEKLQDDLQYAGEFAANRARELSPKQGGRYSQGWDYTFTAKKGMLTVEVGNTTKPSLTHLLEKGHMDRGGGWTSAREHIEPTYDETVALLERRMHG